MAHQTASSRVKTASRHTRRRRPKVQDTAIASLFSCEGGSASRRRRVEQPDMGGQPQPRKIGTRRMRLQQRRHNRIATGEARQLLRAAQAGPRTRARLFLGWRRDLRIKSMKDRMGRRQTMGRPTLSRRNMRQRSGQQDHDHDDQVSKCHRKKRPILPLPVRMTALLHRDK